jgi:hypothetical protein
MRTRVFEQQGKWWFKWWNAIDTSHKASDTDGPFGTKESAELERQRFEKERREKYPTEPIQSE